MISMYPKTNGRTLTLPPEQTGSQHLRRLRHAAPKGDEDIAAPLGIGCHQLPRLLLALVWLLVASTASAAVLTTLELRVLGTRLAVTPGEVTVPRNIEGSVKVEFVAGDGSVVPPPGSMAGRHIEGLLRGPGMAAQKVTGRVGDPLVFPPLRVAGDYQLDDVRLVDTASGATVLNATPASVPVHVFDEVLVSRVSSRPLTSSEIEERGILIDSSSYRVVEFEVALVLKGGTFPVRLPVVAPDFRTSTELIPAAELEDRRVQAEAINRELAKNLELPDELRAVMPEFSIQPIQFEEVGPAGEVERKPPTITGLLVIPGRIGYLNQFFSVQLYTENASPAGSGLSVTGLRAGIVLPKGRDGIAGTTQEPGDDPVRMARVGTEGVVSTNLPVRLPGLDGMPGTADDIARIEPGETGMAEFLVEGLQEGLHTLDFELRGTLEGLAAGPTTVRGRTTGAVLVRNAKFSMAFLHPMRVRAGEPYTASVTLVNTGDTIANRLRVGMNRNAMSGTVLIGEDTVELGDVAPGESVTAQFRFRSQRTGQVLFSNLSTSDDSVLGRLQFSSGVDERGVDLSTDAIGFPPEVEALPEDFRRASDRVLGQALGVATAARLPAGVLKLSTKDVTQRVLDLAEAGRRVGFGDPFERVLADLVRDWQGQHRRVEGFEQILRETDAGREWREAVARVVNAVEGGAFAWLGARAVDQAGNGAATSWLAASDDSGVWRWTGLEGEATAERSGVRDLLVFGGGNGAGPWVSAGTNQGSARWTLARASSGAQLRLLTTGTNGVGADWTWVLPGAVAGAEFELTGIGTDAPELRGPGGALVAANRAEVRERPPEVIAVRQDISVTTDRAWRHCPLIEYNNWGTVVGVLFSKPVTAASAEEAAAYVFPDGNGARTVRLQPDGRLAFVQLHRGIGSFAVRPRDYRLRLQGVADPRGGVLAPIDVPVETVTAKGVAVRGRVYGLDGLPAPGVPVTVTMTDLVGAKCLPSENRVAQVFTDESGAFDLDFVAADVLFTIAAVDTRAMDESAARAVLDALLDGAHEGTPRRERLEALAALPAVKDALLKAFNVGSIGEAIVSAENIDRATYKDLVPQAGGRLGTELVIALRFRGRGVVVGRVLAEDGVTPIAGAAVNLFPDGASRELARGLFSGEDGSFRFEGVPLGVFSLTAESPDAATGKFRTQVLSGRLVTPGESLEMDFRLPALAERFVELTGVVQEPDGTSHGNATVYATDDRVTVIYAQTVADADGSWRMRVPEKTQGIAAASVDGRRRGLNLGISLATGLPQFVPVTLQGTARVRGIVRYWNGDPAAGALVGGGDRVVRAGTDGRFELEGVPLGRRQVVAGIDGQNARDGISRVTTVDLVVVPGNQDDLELRLPARARIQGMVTDRASNAVPGIRVAIPQPGGFLWTKANQAGVYEFNGLGLGHFTVSAPSPPVKEKPDELAQRALDAIASASNSAGAEEAAALVGQLAQVYAAGTVGRFSSESFDPGSWGFSETQLSFDGQTVIANIQYLPGATLGGVVQNSQGVPIGAEVTVKGFGPNEFGAPSLKTAATVFSDPSEGTWRTSGFIAGPFSVHAYSPLLVGRPQVSGLLTPERPSLTNIVLRFPAQADLAGRLVGVVYDPDGHPVPGAKVAISFTSDYEITADETGWFDTQLKLPGGFYNVVARSTNGSSNGLMGRTDLRIVGGVTNLTTVQLLGRGDARIEVVDSTGRAATNVAVTLVRSVFPAESGLEERTGTDGSAAYAGLFEGAWRAEAQMSVGATVVRGVTPFTVVRGSNVVARVVLGASGSIAGSFYERTSGAPIGGATIWIRSRGSVVASGATTGDGRFRVEGIPLGTYEIEAVNSVSGRRGFSTFRLSADRELVTVDVVEQALGDVDGFVRDHQGLPLAGMEITLATSRSSDASRKVTSGVDGGFRFPGVPAGPLTVEARDVVVNRSQSVSAVLAEGSPGVSVELQLPPLVGLTVRVVDSSDAPVPQARLLVSPVAGAPGDELRLATGPDGTAEIGNLRVGTVRIAASDSRPGFSSSGTVTNVLVGTAGPRLLRVQLPGVGGVSGRVLLANGQAAANARVDLLVARRSVLTDANGRYAFTDVAPGTEQVRAVLGSLGVQSPLNVSAGPSTALDLRLAGSGGIVGILARASGQPVRERPVLVEFRAAAGAQGQQLEETDTAGQFAFEGLPLGVPITLTAAIPDSGARAEVTVQLSTDGEVLNLGTIRMDEAAPSIVAVEPEAGSVNVPTNVVLRVEFDEPLRPASIRAAGFQIHAGDVTVPVALQFEPALDPTVVTVRPLVALRSRTAHQLVIAGQDRVDGAGRPARIGPVDRVGRELDRTLVLDFVTRDSEAPVIVSVEPDDGRSEIEPLAVMRVTLDEPVVDGWSLVLRNEAGGVVAGTPAISADRRLLSLVPEQPLPANSRFSLAISGITDLSGNTMLPRTNRFTTLDTRPPVVARLALAPGQQAASGSTVTLEARFEADEPSATLVWLREGVEIGASASGPVYRLPVRLPVRGTVTLGAYGRDALGNRGETRTLLLNVVPNSPPVISLARGPGESAPVQTGAEFSLAVSATDDAAVRRLVVQLSGALTNRWELTNGTLQFLTVRLPTNALAGVPIRVGAEASDEAGAEAEVRTLEIPIVDATRPGLATVLPVAGSPLEPSQPLVVDPIISDNSDRLTVVVTLSGDVTRQERREIALTPGRSLSVPWSLDLSALRSGGFVTVKVEATDAAGNAATSISRSFQVRDVEGPKLGSTWIGSVQTPVTNRVSRLIGSVSYRFDSAIRANPAISNLLVARLTNGTALPGTARLGGTQVFWDFTGPLLPADAEVEIVLLPGLSDASGNGLRAADGSPWPASGVPIRFTTGPEARLGVTNGQPVVAGLSMFVDVHHDASLSDWTLLVNGRWMQLGEWSAERSRFRVTLPQTNVIQVVARTTVSGRPAYELPPVFLNVRPDSADDDADGLPNGFEVRYSGLFRNIRLDPFDPADAGRDHDADLLTVLEEYQLGTDIETRDTDGDGLSDGWEVAEANCLDPLDPDSDDDGILDGADRAPCVAGEGVVMVPIQLTATEGVESVVRFDLDPFNVAVNEVRYPNNTSPPPFLGVLRTRTLAGGRVEVSIPVRPGFSDAGVYPVPFQVRLQRAVDTLTTNIVVPITVLENSNRAFTRWAAPRSGQWTEVTNWTDGLPGPGRDAVIDVPGNYVVTVGGNVFAESLRFEPPSAGPILRVTGELTLNDASRVGVHGAVELEWATLKGRGRLDLAGRLDGQGTFDNAGVVVEATGRATTRVGTFRFNGPVSNAGVLDLRAWSAVFGGVTTNTGTIRMGTDLTGSGAVFRNEGIIEHAGTNAVTVALNQFEQAGRLELGNDLTLADRSTFELGGTNRIGGRMKIRAGRHVFRTVIPVSDWEVNNAEIQFDVDQVLGELVGTSATVTGAGRVSVSGRAELAWCTLRGDGLFHLEPLAQMNCSGTGLDVFRAVDLAGTTTLTNGAFWMISGVAVTNRGSMTALAGSHLRGGPAGSPGTFLNMGSLRLHGDRNPFNPQAWSVDSFENRGEFTVVDGAVHFDRTVRLGGRTRIESGAALWNSGSLSQLPGSVVEGAGTWEFRGVSAHLTEAVTVSEIRLTQGILQPDASQSWQRLRISGGRLLGTGSVTVRESATFSGGTLDQGGVLILASTAVSTNSGQVVLARRLRNEGRLEMTTDSRVRLSGGELVNAGTVHLRGQAYISSNNNDPEPRVVHNIGLLTSSVSGTGMAWSTVSVLNEGRIEVVSGNLDWSHRLLNAGQIDISGGAVLNVSGASTNTATGSVIGAGLLSYGSGAHRTDAPLDVSRIAMGSATLDLGAAQDWVDFTATGGTVSGPAGVRIRGQFQAPGSLVTFAAGPPVEIATNAVMTVSSGRVLLNRDLINRGRIHLTNSAFIQPMTATIRNQATMEFTAGSYLSTSGAAAQDPRLLNEGEVILRNSATPNGWTQILVENRGRIEVLGGRWNPSQSLVNSGEITVGVGTWVQLGTVTTNLPAGRITGPGRIEFSSGTHTLEGTIDLAGGLVGTGGTLILPSTLRMGSIDLSSVTLDGAGDLEAAASLSSTFGTWRGSGAVRVLAGASGSISGTIQNVDRLVHNAGTLAFRENATLNLRNGTLRNEGLLVVTNGVTIGQTTTNARVELGGTLRKSGAGTFTFQNGIVNQSGRMEITSGVVTGSSCELFLRPGTSASPVIDIAAGAELRWGGDPIHVGAPDPFAGTGLLTFNSGGILALEVPLNLGTLDVAFNANSQVSGNFTLANRTGGRFRFLGAVAIEGGVEIGGRMETAANATVRLDDRLTILTGGALDNLGIVRVREFVNNGTLTGKAPEVRVTGPLRIATIETLEAPAGDRGALPTALASTAPTLRLRWEASAGATFHVERSADLRRWDRQNARVTEPKPGRFEALLEAGTSPIGWFRLVGE